MLRYYPGRKYETDHSGRIEEDYAMRYVPNAEQKVSEWSGGTTTELYKGEEVSLSILLRICDYLNCDIGDICEAVRTDN